MSSNKVAHAKESAKTRRRREHRLVHSVSKSVGASHEQVRECLAGWKSQNKTSIKSVDELQAALDQIGFWKNFDANGLGAEAFEIISKRCPNLKHESTVELFHVFDKDHDGQISAKEFLTGALDNQTKDHAKEAELLFEAWDEDNSGTLSKDEVKKLWTTRRTAELILTGFTTRVALHDTAIKYNIKYLDVFPILKRADLETFAQQKAAKGAKDYLAVIKAEEKAKMDQIVDKIFEKADTDKSGTLSKKEFLDFFTHDEFLAEIRSMSTESEKASEAVESASYHLMWGFLAESSDEIVRKCGEKIKDSMEHGDSEELNGIPAETWEKVAEAVNEMTQN